MMIYNLPDGDTVHHYKKSFVKLKNAGKNSKLGELIGKTVMAATKEALSGKPLPGYKAGYSESKFGSGVRAGFCPGSIKEGGERDTSFAI